jgi:hypothetical protein
MNSVHINVLSSILMAAALVPIARASITIQSCKYELTGGTVDSGSNVVTGTLTGNTLSEQITINSPWFGYIGKASAAFYLDPNDPHNYFSSMVYAVGNFNHGPDWGMSGALSELFIDFTTDAPVECSWSSSSSWAPSGGFGYIDSISLTESGTAMLAPGQHHFWGVASVGGLWDQPINGYGALWFAVPSPSAWTLLLAASVLNRRSR